MQQDLQHIERHMKDADPEERKRLEALAQEIRDDIHNRSLSTHDTDGLQR